MQSAALSTFEKETGEGGRLSQGSSVQPQHTSVHGLEPNLGLLDTKISSHKNRLPFQSTTLPRLERLDSETEGKLGKADGKLFAGYKNTTKGQIDRSKRFEPYRPSETPYYSPASSVTVSQEDLTVISQTISSISVASRRPHHCLIDTKSKRWLTKAVGIQEPQYFKEMPNVQQATCHWNYEDHKHQMLMEWLNRE